MSHVDAEQALAIYRHFCKQTEYVVEYLGVAKKLQNILNVPIPNLKHVRVFMDSLIMSEFLLHWAGTCVACWCPRRVS